MRSGWLQKKNFIQKRTISQVDCWVGVILYSTLAKGSNSIIKYTDTDSLQKQAGTILVAVIYKYVAMADKDSYNKIKQHMECMFDVLAWQIYRTAWGDTCLEKEKNSKERIEKNGKKEKQ